jgi:biotin operon repressor
MGQPAGFKIRHWTDDELRLLRERMTHFGAQTKLAKMIGRTPSAVWSKAKELRLTQKG